MPSDPEVLKERRKNDPEYAERVREYGRKYRKNNLEKERKRDAESKTKKRNESREAYNAYQREWNAKNKDRLNRERRERRKNDPEYAAKIKERDKARYWKSPEKHRNVRLKIEYGITLDDYNKLYESQNGKCAICSEEKSDNGKDGLVVDHCHKKGNIRGLLCASCNNGLGRFKDSIKSLEAAIVYLQNNIKEN